MAATGTPTPNIGLRIPLGTDPASVDDINYNSNLIDTKLGAVGDDSVQDQIDELNSNIANLQKTVVKAGTTDTVLDGSTGIKHANVPSVSGYTLKGLTANFYNDGFYQYYSLFILNGIIYVRNPGNDFTSSTQFKMSYVAVYEKNT